MAILKKNQDKYYILCLNSQSLICSKRPGSFTVKPLSLLLKFQPEGHTFNYSCGKFDVEEKGFSPCSLYNKCNTENILENDKIQTYFFPTPQGTTNTCKSA